MNTFTFTFRQSRTGLAGLLFLILFSTGYGQVSMDSTDFPLAGAVRYRVVDTLPLSNLDILPAGGTAQSWDFTQSIAANLLDTIKYLDPTIATLPFGNVYPTANYAVQILPENTTVFVENTSNSHRWLGVSNPAFPVLFNPQREFLKFSMDYGDRDTSNFGSDLLFPFDVTGNNFDSSRVKNATTELFHYDASGIFMDNEGNTINSLRRSHLTISTDSVWGFAGGNPMFLAETIDTTQGYTWFGKATGVLANANVDGAGNVIYAEFFRNSLLTGLQNLQPETTSALTFPNPSEGVVTFDFAQNMKGEVRILDLSQTLVRKTFLNGQKLVMDLSDLPAGLYIYQFIGSTGMKTATGKISIQH